MVLLVLYDVEKSYVNGGMQECRRKLSPASAFYRQSTSSVRHRHSGIRVSPELALYTLRGMYAIFCTYD
jgi:hypothetical protein